MKPIRKLIVLSIIGLIGSGIAHGQKHYDGNVSIGVKGGFNLSKVFFVPNVRETLNPGMNLGVAFRYIEEQNFGLIAELNFQQRGWRENFDNLQFNYSRTLNYIECPLLTHIYFGRRNRFFINAGPSISLLLGESTNSNFDYKNPLSIENFPNNIHNTKQYKYAADQKLDYGISLGFGGEFSIIRNSIFFGELRAYYGLGNVIKASRTESFKGANSLSFSASLGYWLMAR